jgi:phage recombination protein Bet
MTTETTLARKENNLIAFSDDQVALIKKQIAPKASNDELQLFLYQAKRTGLDPLTRQIYCIHRGGKMNIQTSIDGFRVIAERSGDYGGQDEPEFVEDDGKLTCCKVRVYKFRGDQRYQASVGVAYWNEYFPQDNNFMWKKMPHTMLSKVAEALALRKAYPQDLSGLYTNDEMQQSDSGMNGHTQDVPHAEPIVGQTVTVEDPRSVDELHKEYMELFNAYVLRTGEPEKCRAFLPDNWKKERTQGNYIKAIAAIQKRLSETPIEA